MKTISSHSDLVPYGLNPLTGEACSYSMRTLFDLSAAGCQVVSDFLGMRFDPDNPNASFHPNWNSRVGETPAIASVMLTRKTVVDLIHFVLFNVDGCHVAIEMPGGGFMGLREDDEYYEQHMKLCRSDSYYERGYRVYTNFAATGSNGRNQHSFTGRTE